MMRMRLISARKLSGPISDYELTVEFSWLFGLFRRRQTYRGNYAWKLYPQGYDADPVVIQPWLEAQVQRRKWELETRP